MNQSYWLATIGRTKVSDDVVSLLDNEDRYNGPTNSETVLFKSEDSVKLDLYHQYSNKYVFSLPVRCKWIRQVPL